MNNLSQFILKKRGEFDEKFEDVEDAILCNHLERHVENDDCKKLFGNLKSFLTQSHIELLEEMRTKTEELKINHLFSEDYGYGYEEACGVIIRKLSEAINQVKK